MIHVISLALALVVQSSMQSPACGGDSTLLAWEPAVPTEGDVITIVVAPATTALRSDLAVSIDGEIDGQALHFERDGSGCFRALAPIPVGSSDTLGVSLRVVRPETAREPISANIPVRRLSSGVMQLSVDPRFVSPPDSVLPRIRSERQLVIEVSRRSHETPRLWSQPFLRPRSTRITANFGQRREFNGEFRSLHLGVDLAGSTGAPIVASNRGVVVLVHDFYYAGNAIHIDHGNGLTTAYMHLSETAVAVGDTVARGKVIGKVGATGRVTGPHLHWHAKYGLLTVNPLTLLEVNAVPEREGTQ